MQRGREHARDGPENQAQASPGIMGEAASEQNKMRKTAAG